jgi:hypothetical protein
VSIAPLQLSLLVWERSSLWILAGSWSKRVPFTDLAKEKQKKKEETATPAYGYTKRLQNMQESGQPIRTEEDVILEVERAVDTKMETIQKNMTTAKDWDRPYDKTFAPGVAPWVVVRGHYKGKPVRYPKIDWGEELYWIEQSRRNQLQKIINTTDDCFSKCIVNLSSTPQTTSILFFCLLEKTEASGCFFFFSSSFLSSAQNLH